LVGGQSRLRLQTGNTAGSHKEMQDNISCDSKRDGFCWGYPAASATPAYFVPLISSFTIIPYCFSI